MILKGIDYFPISVDSFEDTKIALIEAEFESTVSKGAVSASHNRGAVKAKIRNQKRQW